MRAGRDKNFLHTEMEGERPRGGPKTIWINKIRKDERGKLGRKRRKQRVGE